MCNTCNAHPEATAYLSTRPTRRSSEIRCGGCRQTMENCRCQSPQKPRRPSIMDAENCWIAENCLFVIDCTVKNCQLMTDCVAKGHFLINTCPQICPICRQDISDCCCAVKNSRMVGATFTVALAGIRESSRVAFTNQDPSGVTLSVQVGATL
ncbi:hypothetical protein CERZMDRAFT_87275 [Cercospora zeae-maydis SCOH1-5]|uniref:Uncharacterized protein n=1 Tax=Cercospora zeae-maydis SCOH1-5 TaxID=717836 RepID=A0A6A6F5R7_9PEZI|nr:hypothetical protein CERZMDRAFT_87275 [Cercospora zeae-maydis SCOH1-5]